MRGSEFNHPHKPAAPAEGLVERVGERSFSSGGFTAPFWQY